MWFERETGEFPPHSFVFTGVPFTVHSRVSSAIPYDSSSTEFLPAEKASKLDKIP